MPEIPIEAVLVIAGTFGAAIAYYYRGKKDKALSEFIRGRSDLQNFLVEQLPLPLPETEIITREDIEQALEDAGIDAEVGRDTDADIMLVFTDMKYFAPKPYPLNINRATDVMSITEWLPYQPEIFDCENFSGLFWSLTMLINGVNSVGYVLDWSAGHSYNVMVDSEGGVTFLEPQTDDVVKIEDDSSYKLERGILIF